ncbi:MAG: glycosyltransferase family 4 protein [Candidatus Kerfeldbacteria bacterium]|nr:glycosyltransferase family 4 protein [Candidatus Kerfeldbacteria bacterium]
MRILFLTRKFPPQKGGMETFSWELTENYAGPKTIIHYGQRKLDILWAAPLLCVRALFLSRRVDLIHLGDLVLGPIAIILKWFMQKPIVVTVHALELTFNSIPGYQWLIRRSLRSINHFVAVSDFTADLLKKNGIPAEKISIITHGVVQPPVIDRTQARKKLAARFSLPTEKPWLLTVGRLVRRKGVAWFIEHVFAKLPQPLPIYLIVSTGPEKEQIESLIQQLNLAHHVRLLGKVTDEELRFLYSAADLFVMPNINVDGDAEGFGFVAIEAAAYGLPVIASRIDGIPSAIADQHNGILITPGDTEAYTNAVLTWLNHPAQRQTFGKTAAAYTREHSRWEDVAAQYKKLFERL